MGSAVAKVRRSGTYRGAVPSFEFLVLTAARSAEVRGTAWEEIDLEAAVWTIPAERVKAAREHRVPLSDRALAVLDEARRELSQVGNLVFPSQRGRMQGHHPMGAMRRDPIPVMAKIIPQVYAIASNAGEDARCTMGSVSTEPASTNTVPGKVSASIDFRHPAEHVLTWMSEQLDALVASFAAESCEVSVERL